MKSELIKQTCSLINVVNGYPNNTLNLFNYVIFTTTMTGQITFVEVTFDNKHIYNVEVLQQNHTLQIKVLSMFL